VTIFGWYGNGVSGKLWESSTALDDLKRQKWKTGDAGN
jgi:hypothetical protein